MQDRHFDLELQRLNDAILKMGLMAEEAIYKSVNALEKGDLTLAEEVIKKDRQIDKMELEIDERCLRLIALYQPMAADLRFITTGMMISTDLERIGDLALDIAERVTELADKPLAKPLKDLPGMAEIVKRMVKQSLDAFVKRETALAKEVCLMEDEADRYRDLICNELLEKMTQNSAIVPQALPLILIARHLERIADHATNIAEDVVYMVDAEVIKHQKRKQNLK